MKALSRIILFYLLSILVQQSAIAQQYPITASTQIIPPYSVYLPDYAVPGSDKLRVILVQNDLTQPSYEVRLRMTVEMNGTVIMRTSPAFTPKPLLLSAGVPTIISGADLYDYLNSNNIDFSGGFSRETYDRTKALPEGAYRISFTAYDYRRSEVQTSNMGSNIFFFQKSEPPVLNQPVCDSRVVKIDPQFLTFNWSSRNTPNPLEGSGTQYVFSLYEIKPKGSNPDYIVKSTQPLYTITTETNTLVYGPGEPQLIDSMDYVWIVQARDKSGRDMYSNQGYSRSCKFSYLSNNPFAANNIGKPKLKAESTGERTGKLSWALASSVYNVESYRLQYRATTKDGQEFDWFTEEKVADSTLLLYNLEPSRGYEARLQWRIAGVYGPFSDLATFTTDALRTFTCGETPQSALSQNTTPLPVAVVGMPVKIGHFDVMLTQVSGSNGVFTGKGRIITPGFGMGLLMEFRGITINTDLVVIRGEMQAVTDGIDKFVSDAVKEQRGGTDVGQVKTGDIVPDVTTSLHIFSKDNIVVNTEAGTITLKDSNTGQEEVVNYKDKGKTLPLVLEDTDGNLYNIDKNGKVTSAGTRDKNLAGNSSAMAALNTLKLDSGVVNFTAATNNRYGFDSWKSSYEGKPVLESSYEKLAEGKYRVSAKALVPGEQEDVIATISNAGSVNTDKIKFISGKGIVYPSKKSGNTWTITLTGGPAGDAQEVYAVYPKSDGQYISMGKLLLASYTPLQNKIVLVAVGAQVQIPEDAIKSSLIKAYGKAGVTYTVTTDNSFQGNTIWDDNKDGLLQDTKSAFLGSGFTGEEKALKNAYKSTHDIDDNTTYLFMVNEAALKDGDLLGKMPRQSQFGFIFMKNASAADVANTVAHETGHGAYTLEHIFSEGIGLSAKSTDNLMDYTQGYDLLKYQWDIIHSPGHVWGIFEGDDDQASQRVASLPESFLDKDKNYTFITYGGQYISVPKEAKNFVFHFGISDYTMTKNSVTGVLQGFEWNNEVYEVDFTSGIKYKSSKSTFENAAAAGKAFEGVIMAMPCSRNLVAYKLAASGLAAYKSTAPASSVNEQDFPVIPFSSGNKILKDAAGNPLTYVLAKQNADCQWCYDDGIESIVSSYCEKPSMLYVSKIAQIKKTYPEYFGAFTSSGSDWANPSPVASSDNNAVYDYSPNGVWGQKMIDDKDRRLQKLYDDEELKYLYFREMLSDLSAFVQTRSDAGKKFFDTLSVKCDIHKVISVVNSSSETDCRAIAWSAREIAFKLLISGSDNFMSQFSIPQQNAIYKITENIADDQIAKMLKLIHDGTTLTILDSQLSDYDDNPYYSGYANLIVSYLSRTKAAVIDDAEKEQRVFNYVNQGESYVAFGPMEVENGQVRFLYRSAIKDVLLPREEPYFGTVSLDAYSTIILLLHDDFKVNGITVFNKADYPKGLKITAIQFYWLYRIRYKEASAQFTRFSMNIPLIMIGGGELAAARGWRVILAIADLQVAMHGLITNTGRYNELYEKYPSARKYLDLWGTVNKYYCIARVTQATGELAYNAFKPLQAEAVILNNSTAISAEVKAELQLTEVIGEGAQVEATAAAAAARVGDRQITQSLYDDLRTATPTQPIRDMVNEGVILPMADEALPGLTITKRLQADHIVPMDKITRMEGFGQLTREEQLQVLNNRQNFVGLSETANKSKGALTFEEWTMYKKQQIAVNPVFRARMMVREVELEGILQQQIDDLLKAH